MINQEKLELGILPITSRLHSNNCWRRLLRQRPEKWRLMSEERALPTAAVRLWRSDLICPDLKAPLPRYPSSTLPPSKTDIIGIYAGRRAAFCLPFPSGGPGPLVLASGASPVWVCFVVFRHRSESSPDHFATISPASDAASRSSMRDRAAQRQLNVRNKQRLLKTSFAIWMFNLCGGSSARPGSEARCSSVIGDVT